jgi:hypothetical protein
MLLTSANIIINIEYTMERIDESLIKEQELVNEQTSYISEVLINTINEVQEECRRRDGYANPLALVAALGKCYAVCLASITSDYNEKRTRELVRHTLNHIEETIVKHKDLLLSQVITFNQGS